MNPPIAADSRAAREQRLLEIRREAEEQGKASLRIESKQIESKQTESGQKVTAGASGQTGYYGMPVLKRPQWIVEVPLYFFVGGLSGAASLIAAVGRMSSADAQLIRHARWMAAIGGIISPALLIADLGVPSRFLNMLRVFKIQSPMSVGSWTLVAFSNSAAATAVLGEFEKRRPNSAVSVLTDASQIVSALTGLVLSTYTGVLIGATAIPAWNENVSTLPIHFAAALETAMGASIELKSSPGTKALRSSVSGWAMRAAGLLSGPLPLALRLLSLRKSNTRERGLRRAAAISSVAGSLLTRWAWVHAGKVSADDNSVPLRLRSSIE